MKKNWIDFKALRAKLDSAQVLKHYGVEVKGTGKQHHGFCPLPNHNGKRNSPSFSANLEKGIFQCFGCGAKGNILDFAVLMEKKDPKDGAALHDVALTLQRRFCPGNESQTNPKPSAPDTSVTPKQVEQKPELPVVVNAPLDFELKGLDAQHPYLLSRGFTPQTIERFGLGFCSRGYFKDRVVVPLFDHNGTLIGYAGRVVDDTTITDENPRYRFPGGRERDGKMYIFHKTEFLYNGHRIKEPVDDLIVVEGFTSVWWVDQNELPHAVGTMGADCSARQADLLVSLVKPGGMVWILSDGDAAGERHTQAVLIQLSPHRAVRWLKLPAGKQPTDLSREELKLRFIS